MYNLLTREENDGTFSQKLTPLAHLKHLLNENIVDLLPEIIDLFLSKTIPFLTEVSWALQINDPKQLQQAAANMKAFAKQMGFNKLTRLAIRLESNGIMNNLDTAVITYRQLQAEHQQIDDVLLKYSP